MSKSLGNVTAPQEVTDKLGADILRLWVVNSDVSEDLRIGPEILKQQAELYRRLRNTLRWLLGSLHGWTEAERVAPEAMPELERWILHRLSELDTRMRRALETHDWTGIYPDLHAFCSSDLSAFYFDVRKDSIYCDAPGHPTRRAARTVLDLLHRCLTAWLAPVLCFTAEEAWLARFPSEDDSIHLQSFPEIPDSGFDATLSRALSAFVGPKSAAALKRDHRSTRNSTRGEADWFVSASRGHDPARNAKALNLDLRRNGPNWRSSPRLASARPSPEYPSNAPPAKNAPAAGASSPKSASEHADLCLRCTAVIQSHPPEQAAAD